MPDAVIQPVLVKFGDDATTAQVGGASPSREILAFDDTTEEFAKGGFFVPVEADTAGTVTFRMVLLPVTAAASKNVQFRLYHAPLADGEASDVSSAWTTKDSGDIALDATQGDITIATFTETLTNLGWVAGDWVPFRLGRVAAAADDLVGDVQLLEFDIEIPELVRLETARWDDLRFPAQGINPPGAATDPDVNAGTAMLEFLGNKDCLIAGVAQLPHEWKQASDLSPHIHVIPNGSASGNQRWKIEWEVVPINHTWDLSTYSNSETITFASGSYQETHKLVPWADWDMSTYSASGVSICIQWRITRLANSDGADTDTTTCTLLEFDIHRQADTPGGSRLEASK